MYGEYGDPPHRFFSFPSPFFRSGSYGVMCASRHYRRIHLCSWISCLVSHLFPRFSRKLVLITTRVLLGSSACTNLYVDRIPWVYVSHPYLREERKLHLPSSWTRNVNDQLSWSLYYGVGSRLREVFQGIVERMRAALQPSPPYMALTRNDGTDLVAKYL